MLAIPPETLADTGLTEGQTVTLRSRPGHLEIEPEDVPDEDVTAFTSRFVERYREALRQLADL